jgi:hypothetical protein
MNTFFASVPLEYLHHDDRINPRSIGSSIRGLIEEYLSKNPQLHVGLAWWAPQQDGAGPLKVFDGQHKAAAQILLGIKELPVRIFVEPDINVLLDANTNAGGKLHQVALTAPSCSTWAAHCMPNASISIEQCEDFQPMTTPSRRLILSDFSDAKAGKWRVTSSTASATPPSRELMNCREEIDGVKQKGKQVCGSGKAENEASGEVSKYRK